MALTESSEKSIGTIMFLMRSVFMFTPCSCPGRRAFLLLLKAARFLPTSPAGDTSKPDRIEVRPFTERRPGPAIFAARITIADQPGAADSLLLEP